MSWQRQAAAELPSPAGLSLKVEHFGEILGSAPAAGWFEVHTENLMGGGGPLHRHYGRIREDYAFSLHGVGLSLGSAGALDERHLARVVEAVRRYEPVFVSEHVAWAVHDGRYLGDLLPLPYSEEALSCLVRNVDRMQEALQRLVLVENPSQYAAVAGSDYEEPDFLNELASRTGCGLLLDVNNIHVSCSNLGLDARHYLERIDLRHVAEIHLAGACEKDFHGWHLLIDDHGSAVQPPVWALYAEVVARAGAVPTLIEWDTNLPTFAVLADEAAKVTALLGGQSVGSMRHAAAG